jgi:threonine dehydratase
MKVIILNDWFVLFSYSSFDHPHILAGQGSLGLEVLDQVPDVDAIIIPTGTWIWRS